MNFRITRTDLSKDRLMIALTSNRVSAVLILKDSLTTIELQSTRKLLCNTLPHANVSTELKTAVSLKFTRDKTFLSTSKRPLPATPSTVLTIACLETSLSANISVKRKSRRLKKLMINAKRNSNSRKNKRKSSKSKLNVPSSRRVSKDRRLL